MKLNIGIPPGLAYGADEAVPDMPVGMSVGDAIYNTVHNYPGGVSAIAARMGVSPNTLTHKANPNNTTHHLHPQELVALQHLSGNAAVLHAMAQALGYVVHRATPDQSGGDPVDAVMRSHVAYADLTRAVADPLARMSAGGDEHVTGNEMRRAEYMAQEAHAAIDYQLATLRGRMRPAPKDAP